MWITKNNNRSSHLVTLVFASLVLILLPVSINEVFAMGEAPATCPNRYDGPFTSATITVGNQTYDPITNPGLTFELENDKSYTVTFTIHTPAQSSQGNSDPGTTWYDSTAIGFGNGACVSGVGPNQDVVTIDTWHHPASMEPDITQSVEYGTFGMTSFTYNVKWVSPTPVQNTTSKLIVNSQDNNGNSITGFFTTISQNGNQISTGFTPTEFILNNDQSYTVNVAGFDKYVFDHWSDTGSTVAARNISISTDTMITAVYKTIPQPPTGLTATGKLLQISLGWNVPSDNGGSAIVGYMIERSTDGGSTWSTIVPNSDSTGTTYSDKNVNLLTTYTYRVSAINDVGTSDPSNTASAKTPSVGPITPPSLP